MGSSAVRSGRDSSGENLSGNNSALNAARNSPVHTIGRAASELHMHRHSGGGALRGSAPHFGCDSGVAGPAAVLNSGEGLRLASDGVWSVDARIDRTKLRPQAR